VASLIVVVGYFSALATRLDKRTRDVLFLVCVAIISLAHCLDYVAMAAGVFDYSGLDELHQTAVYRMNQGGVPSFFNIWVATPLLAAPAAGLNCSSPFCCSLFVVLWRIVTFLCPHLLHPGTQIHRMKQLAMVDFILYVVAVFLIYSNAGSLKDFELSCLASNEKPSLYVPSTGMILFSDAMTGLILFAALSFSCLPAVQAGEGYVGLLRAGRDADSVK